ncbi:amino acid adenylation domain-containing protein [Legionella sp. PC997]|uniref:amino acid adenylation domain-containing protein n=1 Tax=Legionella sp. PC997 TaxID=2755562 RepID=UPI0015FD83EC|nr:amino acid adenylation domain-containing protein [Legionella sp. PC997]
MIRARNHQLLGLISQSKNIKKWCKANDIPYIKNIKEFENNHMNQSCDYLFSIANGAILPPSILNYPRVHAVNYHNSPLPKYAGLYATTWAILNDEKEHAISWHVMHEQVDSGDILKQSWFSIEDDETALSLNLKCYEHAVKAFHELLIEFETNTTTLVKQNLAFRSYYGLQNKPEYYGFISWENPSEHIDRLCRALTFGHYKNELATPKLLIQGQVLVIKSYRKLGISSGERPGIIVHISNTDLQITTGSTDIVLYELMSLTGDEYPIERLIEDYALAVGQRLPDIDTLYIQRMLSHPAVNQTRVEQFWLKELLQCIHGGVSFLSHLTVGNDKQSLDQPRYKTITISDNLFTLMKEYSKNHSVQVKNIIFGVLLTYIYRLNNYKNFSLGYSPTSFAKTIECLDNILERHVPLTTHFESSHSFRDILSFIEDENERINPYATFCKDVFIRYPELQGLTKEIDISFTFCDTSSRPPLSSQKKLNFYIPEDGSSIYVHNNTEYQSQEESYAFFNYMEHHLHTLLEDALNRSDSKIFELSILNKEEEHCLLHEWNDTHSVYDSNVLLHHEFERQAAKTPLSIAAIFNNVTITYEELNIKANQVAQYLTSHGVKPGDIIGIYIHREMYMLISILGVLKSGAAYLPLDPHYPDRRINYMLSHSQSKILLTHQASVSKHIHGYSGLIIDVEDIIKSTGSISHPVHIATKPSDLAYVIYTSGTTGKPKGVTISHLAASNHMHWMRQTYDFNDSDVFLQKTPFSFDASVWEFFMPLWVGATVVIAPRDAHASPKELIALVKKNKVSILQLVPSMLREMILTPKFKSCSSLRHVFCGGEVLLPETIHAFYEYNSAGCKLHNLYGPTEATIDALTHTCSTQDETSHVSRIGKPISNTNVYILDDHMKPVPTGILGELYISGHGLAYGYLHNEELTQQKFLPNPFESYYNRIYKTGDLVKWQNNGTVEYHERRDTQIKIRGFRIEISEIESSLDKIPSIYQCLVKPEKSKNGDPFLCAYLVLRDNEEVNATDIRSFLKDELPDYMIPTRFFVVDKLLTTPNGKLDRTSAIVPLKQLFSSKEHLTPQNDIEKVLHGIWCAVLNNEYLGIYDDFFEMGGHSLSAMNVISQIQQLFSIKLSIRTLFDFPMIHSLAIEIKQLLDTNQQVTNKLTLYEHILIPIKESGNKTPIFLIHPIGGSIFWYKSLGVYLEQDIPLYGLQDPGLEYEEFFFKTIEEMAETYIKVIQTIQPHGPYIIGGASFGSTVAVEIAQQLQEMDERVKAIISLDGWAEYPALQRDEDHFKELMREHNVRISEHHKQHQITNSDNLLELQWHREKMLMHYKLPRIKTNLILFKAESLTNLFNYDAPLNWWDNYTADEITYYLVPGNHESMFSEPNIKTLANKLNVCLNSLDSLL